MTFLLYLYIQVNIAIKVFPALSLMIIGGYLLDINPLLAIIVGLLVNALYLTNVGEIANTKGESNDTTK